MKTLLLIGTLLGGFFATNDTAQEYAVGAWDHTRGMFQHEAITEEEDALRDYIHELMLDYSEVGLTDDEIAVQRAYITSLIEAKALELGVSLNIDFNIFDRYQFDASMFQAHEDMEILRDYYEELVAGYDFSTMTSEEIAIAQAEIQSLLEAKALELGIDTAFGGMMPYGGYSRDFASGNTFGGHHGHRPRIGGRSVSPYTEGTSTDTTTVNTSI